MRSNARSAERFRNAYISTNVILIPRLNANTSLYYYRREIYIWFSTQVAKCESERSHVDSLYAYIQHRKTYTRVDLYFFAHMCISFPVIVSESNKTADATCPRRKTGQTNFVPSHDTPNTPCRRKNHT